MAPDKTKTMDAAEKLMLDLMEKHPGASESSRAGAIPKRRKGKTRGACEQSLGNFMKHSLGGTS